MRPTTTVCTLFCNIDVIWRHCLRAYLIIAFTDDDKIVIKFLRQNKHHAAKRFISEFPEKRWSLTSLKRLIRKIDATGMTERTKEVAADHEQRERCTTLIALTSLQSVRKTSPALIQHREWLAVQISCTYIIVKYRDITRTLYLTIDSQLVGGPVFLDHGVYVVDTSTILSLLIRTPFHNFVAVRTIWGGKIIMKIADQQLYGFHRIKG